jgi:hypothetical protein
MPMARPAAHSDCRCPTDAGALHALGWPWYGSNDLMVRRLLRRAAEAEPERTRYARVRGRVEFNDAEAKP